MAATIYAAVKRGLRRLSAGLRSGERDDNANPPPSSPTSKRRSDQRNRVVDEGRAESNWAPTAACERSNKTLTFKRTQGVGLKMQIRRTKNAKNAKNAKKMQLTREKGGPRQKKVQTFKMVQKFSPARNFCQEKNNRKCKKCNPQAEKPASEKKMRRKMQKNATTQQKMQNGQKCKK